VQLNAHRMLVERLRVQYFCLRVGLNIDALQNSYFVARSLRLLQFVVVLFRRPGFEESFFFTCLSCIYSSIHVNDILL
jgi:hypothetical protein